ncbi:MAG: TIM barrel protein [Chloroflexi bacterium]|nr:TIM barrel protein [Chloroflexota bacterium]
MNDFEIQIGMNGRFFPNNWRPAREEIAFAQEAGFSAIQFPGTEAGLDEEMLDDSFDDVAEMLRAAHITPVMEIVVRLEENGRTQNGSTPLQHLAANLPAIAEIRFAYVHWHLVVMSNVSAHHLRTQEQQLVPDFQIAASMGKKHGFRFGLEHNAFGMPQPNLFETPESIQHALTAVPTLGFVWDINHHHPKQLSAYRTFANRLSMLHISDTPQPKTNHHWPLGKGSIDLVDYCQIVRNSGFQGPAILEIGGLPFSGGFGQDTDGALLDSRKRLHDAIAATTPQPVRA